MNTLSMSHTTSDIASPDLGKIAVLLGGCSNEREVSLNSGNRVVEALRSVGMNADPFDPAHKNLYQLKEQGYTVCFIALHGGEGEDGRIQGSLDLMGIPYTGSGVLGSAIGMDKWRTKLLWQAAGIPVPGCVVLHSLQDGEEAIAKLGLPLAIKPANGGSSLGFSKVDTAEALPNAFEKAQSAKNDGVILAEEYIEGYECTIALLEGYELPLVGIIPPVGEKYDYFYKYQSSDTQYQCPAHLSPEISHYVRDLGHYAFALIGGHSWGRIDLIVRGKEIYLLEANTSPGLTSHSLVPMAAQAVGLDYPSLCQAILQQAQHHSSLSSDTQRKLAVHLRQPMMHPNPIATLPEARSR